MNYQISARTHTKAVENAADALSVPLPAAYLEQVAQAQAFADAAAQIKGSDLHAAVFDAIEAGRDYWADKTVQRLALNQQLASHNISINARTRADQLRARALADHADDILEGWADALDPHADALAAAAEAVPNIDLRQGHEAATHGGDVLKHWAAARTALDAWNNAHQGFYALAAVAGISVKNTGHLALTPARRAELEPAESMARDGRCEVDAWVLARCGLPLELATLGEFMSRAAQFNADREAEDRAAEQQRMERVQKSW
ncbi:aldehyde dehydrogenase [Mycobacterium sherrisii]|uniref:Aldehyde dehydrogenase n=1 Tax=Mycobacterium sherrisii TaxID=243061 RepID=A0A1E3SWA0_9MYCO|nr:aldehyde dehydrogenase [Mycobacterium sherrisii]ODR06426.1 aldehyde dehydrogenase [Mycobacterium sherrisii]